MASSVSPTHVSEASARPPLPCRRFGLHVVVNGEFEQVPPEHCPKVVSPPMTTTHAARPKSHRHVPANLGGNVHAQFLKLQQSLRIPRSPNSRYPGVFTPDPHMTTQNKPRTTTTTTPSLIPRTDLWRSRSTLLAPRDQDGSISVFTTSRPGLHSLCFKPHGPRRKPGEVSLRWDYSTHRPTASARKPLSVTPRTNNIPRTPARFTQGRLKTLRANGLGSSFP